MFRQLEYQDRVLNAFDTYLDVLSTSKAKYNKAEAVALKHAELEMKINDYTEETWEEMRKNGKLPPSRIEIPFTKRTDGCGRPVPNVVFKVPTGGGKTWLAVSSVSRIMNRYLGRNAGFVLWVVPNEAIYTQTLNNLNDLDHPYRQELDRAAAGHVRILEKGDRLDAREVDANLCVMILMLPSTNREKQKSLKIFQDRGDIHGFFPPEGEQQAHKLVKDSTPNLSTYAGIFPMVEDTLGNAIRVTRPVVVLDEGHKATTELSIQTLYGFNPCFVLELTATPQDVQPRGGKSPRKGIYSNVLVEISGRELDQEGMIKMPINLDPKQDIDWKATLDAGLKKLNELNSAAKTFLSETNRYIRPIMVIQVERTGFDQRGSGHIHADDVRDWLLAAGFEDAEIAVKTAEQNDLNDPEYVDLLSPTNRVRAIITKQALQEGWDCPFAYVLCSLVASSNKKALTQLVGRILRQPHALKTGIESLDECHIITHHASTAEVIDTIKHGLEKDGLGDLVLRIPQDESSDDGNVLRTIERRPSLINTEIYLPRVMYVENEEVRELDYDTDVLSAIDWRGFNPRHIIRRIPKNAQAAENQLRRIRLSDADDELITGETIANNTEQLSLDPVYIVRMLSDIVPNAFVCREIVEKLIRGLKSRGFDDELLGRLAGLILENLRSGLLDALHAFAEKQFKSDVEKGRIQFRLRLDGRNWEMPPSVETTEPVNSRQLQSDTGEPLSKSLFSPVYEAEFNPYERDVAVYLDREEALAWWYRNVAMKQYGLQGWRKSKVYPDFIFAIHGENTTSQITILETKGDQLDNLDTAYKRELMTFLSKNFSWDDFVPAGEIELVTNNEVTVKGALVLFSEWKTELPKYL